MTDFLFPVLGYLLGSLPFSIWVTRFVKGVDVRDAGSGHATTTNTIRQAGFGWGALVFVLDVAKGYIPTYLAAKYTGDVWIVTLTAAFAVVGHCWPLFAGLRGGMGLATAGGTFLAIDTLTFLICVGLLILGGDGHYFGSEGEKWRRIGRAVFGDIAHAPVVMHPQGRHWVQSEFNKENWRRESFI